MKRTTIAGHSLHPMLIVFPLGLFVTSVVWDIVFLSTKATMWSAFAFWSIVAGLVGGLLAAVPGLLDWLAIPRGTRASRVATLHGFLNLMLMALFGLSLALRAADGYTTPALGAMAVGWVGVLIGIPSSWLGGELVERLGIGVDEQHGVNAPSSLDHRDLPPPDLLRPSDQSTPNLA